ncbi:MAG: DegT/DnrJ/EryC1/StrS family aminotransferase [Bacteroidales bacterium]|nr:DegT/DnrJ/EryC1/StrS family aminotransferase [Bacteroidales bacterium]
MKIQMVDLNGQYQRIKPQIDEAIASVINSCAFINGPQVKEFAEHLQKYLGVRHVIPCANGTDALQIALMAIGLKPGDEVIVPAFTYVATAEVIGLLGLTPVMVDVDPRTFNITPQNIEKGLTSRTKAIVPVHLFGQSCNMEPIMEFAQKHNLYVIEDNAQALGGEYLMHSAHSDADSLPVPKKTGTMGHIGCTSFFPSKNLGCYGDGGAMMTNDDELAEKMRMIANHGQRVKYHHSVIGCNSRLDTIQAAILDVKLARLDEYCEARRKAASYYTQKLSAFDPDGKFFLTPYESAAAEKGSGVPVNYKSHVYHQYTLIINNGNYAVSAPYSTSLSTRDALKEYLAENGVPSMVYYPLPLQEQEAFKGITVAAEELDVAKDLSGRVLSLPMHTELTEEVQDYIIDKIKSFFIADDKNV